jgi:hypothetical protein
MECGAYREVAQRLDMTARPAQRYAGMLHCRILTLAD